MRLRLRQLKRAALVVAVTLGLGGCVAAYPYDYGYYGYNGYYGYGGGYYPYYYGPPAYGSVWIGGGGWHGHRGWR